MNTAMTQGKASASERRRARVLATLDAKLRADQEITVSAVARDARVDRSFLYRHRDLLERIHVAASAPAPAAAQDAVSRISLQADLAAALDRNKRLQGRIQQLEKRLSELMGEQAWAASGLGAPLDIDQLQRRLAAFEQHNAELRAQLQERTEELEAARAANRELTRALNRSASE